ncbi:hypothetical protein VNO78_27026 [Psophocarpus tetragonolobus]|uniref:Legume lectin domain-containing protein n=1 Tax=Psophocarpus tetragonolobus TaxID=3891 RepID=A0AAN9S0F7_PSOTE
MAMKTSRTQTQTLVSALTIIIISLGLSQTVKSASFTFPNFASYPNDITFQGSSYLSGDAIQLTPASPYSVGRASYAAPIHIWDVKTGRVSAFNTTFSFVVAPTGPGLFGDGFAFFVAPYTATIPQNSTGGYLGLFSSDTALNVYKNQIVAVEFDSFGGNPWDPKFSHVGIDVNSIASVTTAEWESGNGGNGFFGCASVSYEPVGKSLDVVVTYPGSHGNMSFSLSFVVDLRSVLPEWVRVGFSGATGRLVESHKILSWSFTSSFY